MMAHISLHKKAKQIEQKTTIRYKKLHLKSQHKVGQRAKSAANNGSIKK